MEHILTQRVTQLRSSPTIAVADKARALQQAGREVINLGVGEPDFDTPSFIKEAAKKAIVDGFTKYTAVGGYAGLKEAIIEKLQRDNKLIYTPKEIIASTGAKQAIFNLIQVLIEAGDEVIIPAPYWVSYPDIVKFCGGQPRIVDTHFDQNFILSPEQLKEAITKRTKLLMINSPSNPAGIAYSKQQLQALAEVLLVHPQVWIMTDDIYESIYWHTDLFHNLVMVCPELKSRTIVINGVSKAYAMTGWRSGYAAGPQAVIQAMHKVQSQSTSAPCSIAQVAAKAALCGDQTVVTKMVQAYKERHDRVYQVLSKLPGIKCLPSHGTFYLYPNVRKLQQRLALVSDQVLAEDLLEKTGVALVPGSAFGVPHHLRLSCAADIATLERAIEKLSRYTHAS